MITLNLKKKYHFKFFSRFKKLNNILKSSAARAGYLSFLKKKKKKSNVQWIDINWVKTQQYVFSLQKKIFKAKQMNQNLTVRKLQIILINSTAAKRLSVLQVTTLNSPILSLYSQIFLTNKQKITLANSLSLNGKAGSFRLIDKTSKITKKLDRLITRKSKKKSLSKTKLKRIVFKAKLKVKFKIFLKQSQNVSKLSFSTIKDRAKQTLAKLALEPEWEAVFEANSYGFRPGRTTQDAIEAIFLYLHHNRPKYIYKVNLLPLLNFIDYNILLTKLNTFRKMKEQIKAWFKAGIMTQYTKIDTIENLLPSTAGRPQEGVIASLFVNILFHGLENHLKNYASTLNINIGSTQAGKEAKSKALGVVRSAHEFLLIHQNPEILEICMIEAKNWLKTLSLVDIPDKDFQESRESFYFLVDTEITEDQFKDVRESFCFLGFQIILVRKNQNYKVKIIPSKQSCKLLMNHVRSTIKLAKTWSSYKLIQILRPKIIGWANFFRYCECAKIFVKLTNTIYGSIRAWVFRKNNRRSRKKVKAKYFPGGSFYFNQVEHKDNWILVGQEKINNKYIVKNFLPHISWINSEKHVKVSGNNSPYDSTLKVYWENRLKRYSTYPPSYKSLLNKQNFMCSICKSKFNVFDKLEIDHIIPRTKGGKNDYLNLQLIHKTCHIKKTQNDVKSYFESSDEPLDKTNLKLK